ncbi:hypothetical protein HID58_000973, partial [Brassica napus]
LFDLKLLGLKGFRKADPEQWEFANDDFVRGQPHLMKNIHRRKPVHSHSLPNLQAQQNALTDSERQRMSSQIERLTKEKEGLLQKLHRQEQERDVFEQQVKKLKDQLQHMEKRQKTMDSYVSQVMETPELALNLSPCLPETNERKRRLPRMLEDNQACVVVREEGSTSASDETEHQVEELESSIAVWENLVSVSDDSCEGMAQSTGSMMILDVDDSSTCPESPPLSCIHLSIDTCPKSPPSHKIIDINSDVSKEQNIVAPAPPPPATGVNDVFWQQLLTENPGSAEQREVQPEKKEDKGEDPKIKLGTARININAPFLDNPYLSPHHLASLTQSTPCPPSLHSSAAATASQDSTLLVVLTSSHRLLQTRLRPWSLRHLGDMHKIVSLTISDANLSSTPISHSSIYPKNPPTLITQLSNFEALKLSSETISHEIPNNTSYLISLKNLFLRCHSRS